MVLFSRSLENGRLVKGEPLPVSAGRGFFCVLLPLPRACNPSILIAAADAPSKMSFSCGTTSTFSVLMTACSTLVMENHHS
jgi:hypothetical protein